VNALNHTTLRRAPRGRPDLAGCPPRPSVHPDGRSSKALCKNSSDTGRTAHFRAMGPQRGALTPERRSASGADLNRMANLACPRVRPHPTMRVLRNDRPCNRCGRGCLLAPSADRTRPAGTLPSAVSNVAAIHQVIIGSDFWSTIRRELALGVDVGCLVLLLWNHSKSVPCLLVRHKYQHTNHHAAASLSFKFVPAPLGATHDTNGA